MEADKGTKIETHSAPKIEAHGALKMGSAKLKIKYVVSK